MKKTDKKTDKAICAALTDVCEIALQNVPGFQWLTHVVNYKQFPSSLRVVCVFERDEQLLHAKENQQDDDLRQLIKTKLATINVPLNDIHRQIRFDTEEACTNQNNGHWHERH